MNQRPYDHKELWSAQMLTQGLVSAVSAAGPAGIPSGTVFACVSHIYTLDLFERLLTILVRTDWIIRDGHLLKPGPKALANQ